MHGETVHLPLQQLHARRCDHGAHVGHHRVREDLVDQTVVAEIARVRHLFD